MKRTKKGTIWNRKDTKITKNGKESASSLAFDRCFVIFVPVVSLRFFSLYSSFFVLFVIFVSSWSKSSFSSSSPPPASKALEATAEACDQFEEFARLEVPGGDEVGVEADEEGEAEDRQSAE